MKKRLICIPEPRNHTTGVTGQTDMGKRVCEEVRREEVGYGQAGKNKIQFSAFKESRKNMTIMLRKI